MKKIALVFSLIIIMASMKIASPATEDDYVIFSMYNQSDDTWSNLTINAEYFETSENDGMKIKFISSPWDDINRLLDKENFFDTDINENNSHTIIEASVNGKYNKQLIGHENVSDEEMYIFFYQIYQRVTGIGYKVWPADLSITTLESYPEQYSVSVLFQRGLDLLAYVHSENATLQVTSANPFEPGENIKSIYTETITVDIASGGQSVQVEFATFTGSTEYRELYFSIVMESGVYLMLPWNSTIPIIGSNGIIATIPWEQPLPGFEFTDSLSAFILISVIILRKKKSVNQYSFFPIITK